jgi:hypothetical protein
MRVQVFQVFFKNDGAGNLVPSEPEIFALAAGYAEQNLSERVDFRDYKNTWVACEVDEAGKPARALGLLCMVLRADFPVCRFTDNAAVVKLVQRANDYMHDYGGRGTYALVRIDSNDGPEDHCPNYLDWMKAFDLQAADRWAFKVR